MNEHLSKDERERLLVEHTAGALTPSEADDLALFADLLSDDSTWAAPSPALEDTVVRAVIDAPQAVRRGRSRFALVAGAAAAAIVAVAVLSVALLGGSNGPDYSGRLAATGVIPAAHATIDIARNDAGFRVKLHARGLPALPPRQYYQAWMKDPAGTLVPIGTFSSSGGDVTLWSGVSPAQFSTITVTIESADIDQQSSGKRVLIGEVHAR